MKKKTQKELKQIVFSKCATLIYKMKTKKDRAQIAEALGIVFRLRIKLTELEKYESSRTI